VAQAFVDFIRTERAQIVKLAERFQPSHAGSGNNLAGSA